MTKLTRLLGYLIWQIVKHADGFLASKKPYLLSAPGRKAHHFGLAHVFGSTRHFCSTHHFNPSLWPIPLTHHFDPSNHSNLANHIVFEASAAQHNNKYHLSWAIVFLSSPMTENINISSLAFFASRNLEMEVQSFSSKNSVDETRAPEQATGNSVPASNHGDETLKMSAMEAPEQGVPHCSLYGSSSRARCAPSLTPQDLGPQQVPTVSKLDDDHGSTSSTIVGEDAEVPKVAPLQLHPAVLESTGYPIPLKSIGVLFYASQSTSLALPLVHLQASTQASIQASLWASPLAYLQASPRTPALFSPLASHLTSFRSSPLTSLRSFPLASARACPPAFPLALSLAFAQAPHQASPRASPQIIWDSELEELLNGNSGRSRDGNSEQTLEQPPPLPFVQPSVQPSVQHPDGNPVQSPGSDPMQPTAGTPVMPRTRWKHFFSASFEPRVRSSVSPDLVLIELDEWSYSSEFSSNAGVIMNAVRGCGKLFVFCILSRATEEFSIVHILSRTGIVALVVFGVPWVASFSFGDSFPHLMRSVYWVSNTIIFVFPQRYFLAYAREGARPFWQLAHLGFDFVVLGVIFISLLWVILHSFDILG